MTDHAMGADHLEGRAAELDSQSTLCPSAWGKPGWKLWGDDVCDAWLLWPT